MSLQDRRGVSHRDVSPEASARDALFAAAQAGAAPTVYSGVCHGTLGELWQGPCELDGELHIGLISLPVRKYSWMHYVPGETGQAEQDLAGKDKCRLAIELYLQRHGKTLPPGRWSHDSELPLGKGMASSTADLVATIRCLDRLFGLNTPAAAMADLLRGIERSDSVFLDRHALYLSGRQQVLRSFNAPLRLHACYIDEGGTVETEKLAEPLLRHYQRHLPAYRRHLQRAVDAFERIDTLAICECATHSAQLAQWVTPKRHFETLRRRQHELGADGIVVAHTGSLLGYLFVARPDAVRMGELSSFFRGLGSQCRFAETGL
ncbi:GHMP family kinase ATP-binding protein [Pseudomonas sp. CGJS7]|uniref:GHMP family kinase ATP-binding protein n=1 Tax=Pseudomonas sp. CGJS7 TaxID=3109348 RepID=UPI003008227E